MAQSVFLFFLSYFTADKNGFIKTIRKKTGNFIKFYKPYIKWRFNDIDEHRLDFETAPCAIEGCQITKCQ